MLDGWRANGWPGFLLPENERLLRWAVAVESLGAEAADAFFAFEVDEGNEELLMGRMQMALGFIRRRAHEAGADAGERADG